MSLKNLKVSGALPCSECERNCSRRSRAPAPRHDAVSEALRYFLDVDNSVVDTCEFRILKPGDPGFEEALVRAQGLDVMIKVATDQHSRRKAAEVQGVIERSKELLEAARHIYLREPLVLDQLFEFGPDARFKDRLPPLMREHLGLV